MRERKDREAQRESKRRGEGRKQEFPIKIFLSAVALGWLLRQFWGIDGKGGGKREREKNEREKRQRGIERVREGEGTVSKRSPLKF